MGAVDVRGILEAFLARMDRGETPDFEALLREHPGDAAELRRLFEAECERLESGGPGGATEVLAFRSGRGGGFGRYSIRGEIGRASCRERVLDHV